jgi:hypothetical protein
MQGCAALDSVLPENRLLGENCRMAGLRAQGRVCSERIPEAGKDSAAAQVEAAQLFAVLLDRVVNFVFVHKRLRGTHKNSRRGRDVCDCLIFDRDQVCHRIAVKLSFARA